MTEEYMTEEEQIAQLKGWVKQYGLTVLMGIILALAIVSSWHYWERRQNSILTHASGIYDEMLTFRAQNQSDNAVTQAEKLLSHYPKTPYAKMAAMVLARDAIIKKDYPTAITQLNWVIDHSSNNAIRSIAKIRVARIMIEEQKPEEALNLLNKIYDKNFNGLADEARGDALLSMHDTAKARAAYQLALQELPNDEATRRPILQMKLDNLSTSTDTKA